ncbi:hypothetical protein D3C81_2053190 [compost metagenome]
MVDEHAGQLVADGFMNQHRYNRGVNAAAQRAQYLAVSNLVADIAHGILDKRLHAPVAFTAADLVKEVTDHLVTVHGMTNLRMELHAVHVAVRVGEPGDRCMLR